MHRIQVLGLTCLAALSWTAAAADYAAPSTRMPAAQTGIRGAAPVLLLRASLSRPVDRLGYLGSGVCLETRGCTTAANRNTETARQYVDALSLGSYGPMNVKFTGDRVKLKVRF